jgi:hypothetical protein
MGKIIRKLKILKKCYMPEIKIVFIFKIVWKFIFVLDIIIYTPRKTI